MTDLDTTRIVRKGSCLACTRLIGLTRPFDPTSPMRRHKDPKSRRKDRWCRYSGTMNWEPPVPEVDPTNNETPSVSFSMVWDGPRRDQDAPEEILAGWWLAKANSEVEMVVAKAIQYGATDLRDLGYQMLEMAGRQPHGDGAPPDTAELATEIGIAMYAIGKVSRIAAAIKEGRRPSYDSWLDLGVYARMAQRVHEVGGWPGVS